MSRPTGRRVCRHAILVAERVGFEPTVRENPDNGFRDHAIQPLGRLSGAIIEREQGEGSREQGAGSRREYLTLTPDAYCATAEASGARSALTTRRLSYSRVLLLNVAIQVMIVK